MTLSELIRKKTLLELLDGMSDNDKRLLLLSHKDNYKEQLDRIEKKVNSHGFVSDLLANVSGNAVYDTVLWLGKSLIKNIKI